jgi:arsenate reductase
MNIQIFGSKKSSDTKKAERWFKERGLKFHSVSLDEKGFSKGELQAIVAKIDIHEMIDENSKAYQKGNYAYLEFDPFEEILENPGLVKMPIIRYGKEASLGFAPEIWKTWKENDH